MTTPSRIDALLAQARAGLDRVGPEDLAAEMAARALAVDVLSVEQRWLYSWYGGQVRGVDLFTVRVGLVSRKLSYVKG